MLNRLVLSGLIGGLLMLCGLSPCVASTHMHYHINVPVFDSERAMLRIAHRFAGQAEEDTWETSGGMDKGALIRLEYLHKIQKGLFAGISRSSWTGNMEGQFKHTPWQTRHWRAGYLLGVNRQTGHKSYRENLSTSYNGMLSLQYTGAHFMVFMAPLYASATDPKGERGTWAMSAGMSLLFEGGRQIKGEWIKPLLGYIGRNDYPVSSLAYVDQRGLHAFQLVLTNSTQINHNRYIATDGIEDARQYHLGFSIQRFF